MRKMILRELYKVGIHSFFITSMFGFMLPNAFAVSGDDDPGGDDPDPCECPEPALYLTPTDCPLYRGMPASVNLTTIGEGGVDCGCGVGRNWDPLSVGECGVIYPTGWTPYGNSVTIRDPHASVLNPIVRIGVSQDCGVGDGDGTLSATLPVYFKEPLFYDMGNIHPHNSGSRLANILRDLDQPCAEKPVRPVGTEPSYDTSFNNGWYHHDVRDGTVLLHGDSVAYAINPESGSSCDGCSVLGEVSYSEEVTVPAVAGTYEYSFPLGDPAVFYDAGRSSCAPSSGQFATIDRECTVYQFDVTNWIHPTYQPNGVPITIGFDITPSDVVLATEESGASYSVRLDVRDPAHPNRTKRFEQIGGTGGQVRFQWDGKVDNYGTDCYLEASDYFMRAWVRFEDRYHDDERISRGPFCFEEPRFIMEAYSASVGATFPHRIIAAGGVDTDPHRAFIRTYLSPTPDIPYTITASLTGGEGGAAFGVPEFPGYSAGEHRPAKLMDDDDSPTYIAGQTTQPISLTSGSSGQVYMKLLSSNRVETCTVNLSSPELNLNENIDFSFDAPEPIVVMLHQGPLPLFEEVNFNASLWWFERALSGHELGFYAEWVELTSGGKVCFDANDPEAIEEYVIVRASSSDILTYTDNNGAATGWLEIVDPSVTSVKIGCSDFTVRKD